MYTSTHTSSHTNTHTLHAHAHTFTSTRKHPETHSHKHKTPINTQNTDTQKTANKENLTKTGPFSARTGPESIKNEIKMCPKKQF